MAITNTIVYVSLTGSDSTGDGTATNPFSTVNKALNSISGIGTIEVEAGDYFQSINSSLVVNTIIRRKREGLGRVRFMGSQVLSLSKTTGYTQIYEATLATEPTQASTASKPARIFEDGTSSMPILSEECHPLHRGQTYRLDFTEMYKADSLAELDTEAGRGKWWYDTGKIYLAATDGSDATQKSYHVATRIPFSRSQSGGMLRLYGIEFYYSSYSGANFSGLSCVEHYDCRFMGNRGMGAQHDEVSLHYERAEFGGNGIDGDNSHMTSGYETSPLRSGVCSQVCIDGWYHDNGDDGKSEHERGEVTLIGGLFEYNWDRGLVMSYGAHYTGYHLIARQNGQLADNVGEGFTVIGAAIDGGYGTTAMLFNCFAEGNKYNYRSAEGPKNRLELFDCVARNAIIANYYASSGAILVRNNCKWSGGTETKTSSGTIITNNDTQCE